jgi:hypothetical protein
LTKGAIVKQFLAILSISLLLVVLPVPASAGKHDAPVDSSRATTPDNKIIPGERIGAIRLGMGMDEVQSQLGKPSGWTTAGQGQGATWYYVDLNLSISFSTGAAPYVRGVSTNVWARKPKTTFGKMYWKGMTPVKVVFQTANGIGLGSTSFDVSRAYSGNEHEDDSYGIGMSYKSLGLYFQFTMDHMVRSIAISNPQ